MLGAVLADAGPGAFVAALATLAQHVAVTWH
jgi:hypothetical protein